MADLFDRLCSDAAEDWQAYVHHSFVEQMGLTLAD